MSVPKPSPAVKANEMATVDTMPAGPLTDAPVLTPLSTVKRESVEWIWPNRMARRKLHILAGEPGEGKSTLLTDLAARVTRGATWPDGGTAPRGSVLLLQAEDGLSDTIAPRLDAAGADDSLVHALSVRAASGSTRLLDLAADLPHLETAIQQLRPVLVAIDPLSAYLPSINSWRDTEVRSVLAPLAALADAYGCAVVGVMHLTKNSAARVLHRITGSIGFAAAARLVLAVATDPDDADRHLLLPVKNNLGPKPAVLAWRRDGYQLVWERDAVDGVTTDSVFAATGTDHDDRLDAESFLRNLLADGVSVPAGEVFAAARKNGIADATLRRAKTRLKVRSRLVGFGAGGKWYWSLPEVLNATEAINHTAIISDHLLPPQTCSEVVTLAVSTSQKSLEESEEISEVITLEKKERQRVSVSTLSDGLPITEIDGRGGPCTSVQPSGESQRAFTALAPARTIADGP